MFISVLVLTTPFLFIRFPPLPAQSLIITTQHYEPASYNQLQFTKYMQRPSTVTQHPSMILPPPDTGAPTHQETSSTLVPESTTLKTTIQPVPETKILPFSEATVSPFQETESGPQIKSSTIKTYHTTGHISTAPAPITTSKPQHFKTSDSPTSGPQHYNISDSPNSSVSLNKKRHTTIYTKIYSSSVDTTTATSTVSQAQSTGPLVTKLDVTSIPSHAADHLNSSKPNWLLVIIIVFFCIFCIGGGSVLVKLRKKKRSEKLRTSLKNGGSYNKKKKNLVNDAWAGPMPASGEKEMEGGGEEEEEVQEKSKEGDEEQMVLSTFTTIQEGKAEALGGNLGKNEADNKAEVPLLQSTKDGEENDSPTAPLSPSLPPLVDDDGEGEQDGGQAFCLTTAV